MLERADLILNLNAPAQAELGRGTLMSLDDHCGVGHTPFVSLLTLAVGRAGPVAPLPPSASTGYLPPISGILERTHQAPPVFVSNQSSRSSIRGAMSVCDPGAA